MTSNMTIIINYQILKMYLADQLDILDTGFMINYWV